MVDNQATYNITTSSAINVEFLARNLHTRSVILSGINQTEAFYSVVFEQV